MLTSSESRLVLSVSKVCPSLLGGVQKEGVQLSKRMDWGYNLRSGAVNPIPGYLDSRPSAAPSPSAPRWLDRAFQALQLPGLSAVPYSLGPLQKLRLVPAPAVQSEIGPDLFKEHGKNVHMPTQ